MTATKQHRNLGRSEAHQISHQYRIDYIDIKLLIFSYIVLFGVY